MLFEKWKKNQKVPKISQVYYRLSVGLASHGQETRMAQEPFLELIPVLRFGLF